MRAGLYLLSLSIAIVYPFTGSRNSQNYQTLVELINQNILNSTSYKLMKLLNITDIFVGSSAMVGTPSWDPTLFLGNPNFALIKNIGTSYLFKLLYHDSATFLVIILITLTLRDGGWSYYVPPDIKNNGIGLAEFIRSIL